MKIKKHEEFKLTEDELKRILRLVEAQRELSYHLQKYKEAVALRVEELKHITAKAQEVQNLKLNWNWNKFINLTEDERKLINQMLFQKHIRV